MNQAETCIVLAGGLGTRLRSAVPDKPKCLAPVGGRSFLEIHLDELAKQGVSRFVLSLGYLAEMVIEATRPLQSRYEISHVVEPTALGTGGAVLFAMQEQGLDEALVTNGDTFLDGRLDAMALSLKEGEAARLAAIEVPDRSRFGGLEIDGTVVTGFLEKGLTGKGLINAGVYRVGRTAFEGFAPGAVFSLESTTLPALVAKRQLHVACLSDSFIDIGVPEDYRSFCERYTA